MGFIRATKRRTTLLLNTAFLAGLAIGRHPFVARIMLDLGIGAASADETNLGDTYRLLSLFGDVFEQLRNKLPIKWTSEPDVYRSVW